MNSINLTHGPRSKLQEKIEWQKFVSCTSRPNVMCGSRRIFPAKWHGLAPQQIPFGYLGVDFHGKTTGEFPESQLVDSGDSAQSSVGQEDDAETPI